MNIWQVACGESGRDYRELFLEHDIMLLGPSSRGDALKVKYYDGKPNSAGNQIDSFARNPKPGDRVILRYVNEVISIGEIPEGENNQYFFDETYRCIYGWDIAHCRRVVWARDFDIGDLKTIFSKSKQTPSFTGINENHVIDLVKQIPSECFKRPLKDLQLIDFGLYNDDELGVELFEKGISNKNIDDIIKALRQAERLCHFYTSKNGTKRRPSEREIVSHVVLPLLLGLGWSHQQIAVEWQKVDMVLFNHSPFDEQNCVCVIEVKNLGFPLDNVLQQPLKYIANLNLKNVKYIIVTDGATLFIYNAKTANNFIPIGYLCVTSLQKEYPIPKETSLVDTLVMLQPNFNVDKIKEELTAK